MLAGLAAALLGASTFSSAAAPERYAVEFRARPGGVFGHTYVVYGRLDGRGQLRQPRYTGIYPSGILSDSILVGVLVMPSLISVKARDRRLRPEMVYRREINAGAFARLAGEVRELRESRLFWNLIFYNCNSFAADVAMSMGLRVPSTLEVPKDFVRDLYVLNRRIRPRPAFAEAIPANGSRPMIWQPDILYLDTVRGAR